MFSNSIITDETKHLLNLFAMINNKFVYVLDVRTNQYLFVSENAETLIGYKSNDILNEGLSLTAKITEEDDKKAVLLFEAKIATKVYEVGMPLRKSFYSSYDYRIKLPDGKLQRILQQNFYLHWDSNGNPAIKLGLVEGIDYLKSQTTLLCKINYGEQTVYFAGNGKMNQIHEVNPVSARQLEVLCLLNEGKGSHEIASLLNISSHTVDNHRRALLEKFYVKDTTALLWLVNTWDILPKVGGLYHTRAKQLTQYLKL